VCIAAYDGPAIVVLESARLAMEQIERSSLPCYFHRFSSSPVFGRLRRSRGCEPWLADLLAGITSDKDGLHSPTTRRMQMLEVVMLSQSMERLKPMLTARSDIAGSSGGIFVKRPNRFVSFRGDDLIISQIWKHWRRMANLLRESRLELIVAR
jgi:hypothetical protein